MNYLSILLFLVLIFEVPFYAAKSNSFNVIENVVDIKDFKKILRTKTNVLVCFTSSLKKYPQIIKVFKDAADIIKGQGTMVLIDCSGDAKKMCKKLKVSPSPYILKHFKDGEFNKEYDRKETVSSMVNFMRDPTGDIPWEEDSTAKDVVHISDANSLSKIIKKETKPLMVMFYAPWCGFCKTLKPEYAAAATQMLGHSVLSAIDVNRPENSVIRTQYNITGFPTILYYVNGEFKFQYEGDNNKEGLISFLKNPQAAPIKLKEPDWSDEDSEVVHLSSANFEPVIKEEPAVLVMFYAPWCGHCKKMKPEYENAAAEMKQVSVPGMLAALDATKEKEIASRFSVKGYPTLKFFSYGEFKFDVNIRDSIKILEFMRDPQEPPPPPPPEKPWSDEPSEVVHLTETTFKPFLKKKKHVLVIFYAPWCGHCKKAKPEFTAAAEKFKDDPKIAFTAVDCTTQQAICNFYSIKGYPTIMYFSYYNQKKPYNGGRTEQDFVSFMSNPEKLVVPAAKPTATGGDWLPDSHVEELTDDTFHAGISAQDLVLVMFYAPWCGHCKKMKPDYNSAAKELQDENFPAGFATVDCTTNPTVAEEFNISGFPTIKLFKQGKFVTNYGGPRTTKDIKKFVKSFSNAKKAKEEL